MVTRKATQTRQTSARTLRAAQELLSREWPGNSPSASVALAYHRRAAALYAHVAETDPDHHHEALFWAQQERAAVLELQQSTSAGSDQSGPT
jgi:hypothetical protein